MNINVLIGKTLTHVERIGDEEIIFTTIEGDRYRMFHHHDCCESVTITEIAGDLQGLVGFPIHVAEERSEHAEGKPLYDDNGMCTNPKENFESRTWTFYVLANLRGYVDIRWTGDSNGYYSESVDFEKMED
jgi:hypothetical protein